MMKDIANVFHHIKNQVLGLCVGADIIILIFGSFQNHVGYCTDTYFVVQKSLKDVEHDLNQRRDDVMREMQQRLEHEKDAKSESERNNHVLR